jgi:hypothetical protein
MMTAKQFNVLGRIEGATRMCVILKGDSGETILCNNRIFNHIIRNPELQVRVKKSEPRFDPCTMRNFHETNWLEAFIPTSC